MDYGSYNHSSILETVWNETESLVSPVSTLDKVIWPQWMDIVIPLVCVLVFFVTLLLIVVFPSRPPGEYKESNSSHAGMTNYEALELRVIPRDSNVKVKMKSSVV